MYAQRVHSIEDTENYHDLEEQGPSWNSSFLFQIAHLRPGQLSFPKLRDVTLHERVPCDTSLEMIIPPSLRKLSLQIYTEKKIVPGQFFLQAAVRQAPLLQHLAVCGLLPWNFVACIAQFPHLNHLNLSGLTINFDPTTIIRVFSDLFRDLAMLGLVELHLPPNLKQHYLPKCVGFSRLRMLFTMNTPIVITAFLNMLATGNLHTFHYLGNLENSDHSDWETCFDALRKRCGSLRSFQFYTIKYMDADFPILETIKPLFDIRGLEDVMLHLWGGFDVSLLSEVMEAVASAWPNLTSLSLNATVHPFQGLVHLIHGCPKLAALDIFLDVEGLPNLSSIPPSSHALQSLSLRIPVSCEFDCILLARLVDKVFPNLQIISVKPSDPRADENTGYMQYIPPMVKAFQAVREECRSGMMG